MLKPTSAILVSQSSEQKKAKLLSDNSMFQKNSMSQQNIDNINTIKIDFTKMSQSKTISTNYTQCSCGAILTIEDKVPSLEKDDDQVIWHCRYCRTANRSKEVYYCPNGAKIILQKNIQRGFLPPILIFVIDLSGSMGESITVELTDNSKSQSNLVAASKQMLQILKNCSFQEKQVSKQAEMKSEYRYEEQKETFKNNSKMKGVNYFSKISLLMAIIENYLNKIKTQPQYSEFRIGFVFFNHSIYILKPAKQKMIPTFVFKNSPFNKEFPFEKNLVQFNDFDTLFDAGKKFQRFFGDSRLKTCDMTRLMVENLETQGQTALGPALALALGITSVHDIGSRIVLISDSVPNIGVLSPETALNNEGTYMKIKKFLQLSQITIGVLTWITDESIRYKQKLNSEFSQFLNSNKQQIVEISLDFTMKKSHLDMLNTARKSLENLINRGSLGEIMSVKVFTSCPRVQIYKLKYDDINFQLIKFVGVHRKNWIQLKLKKLLEEDYLFPVFTQMVVTYEDVFTKEKYMFVSYVKHKITNTSNDKQVYEYLDNSNQTHINQLMDLQKLFKFDRENIILESVASKSYEAQLKKSVSMNHGVDFEMPYCESLNSYAALQNRRYEDDQDEDHCYL